VTVLSPLVILLVGAAIWVDWSDGTIPLPLLLSALALMGLGMWLGAASDRAPLFLASALLSSVIPLVYEHMVGGGAGLSMLPMVTVPWPDSSITQLPSHSRSCGQIRPQISGNVLVAWLSA